MRTEAPIRFAFIELKRLALGHDPCGPFLARRGGPPLAT